MTFEEKLAQAFEETMVERTESLMAVKHKHKFSFAYRLWERKTLRDVGKNHFNKHWTLRKARYAVAAITAVISLLLGGTVYAAFAAIGRYCFDNKVDYSKMLIESHPSDKTSLEEYYGLPEEDGWKMIGYKISSSCLSSTYVCGNAKIEFEQSVIHEGKIKHINTEKSNIDMLSLYTENDGFIMDFGENGTLLCWIYDGYMLEIFGNIDNKEAVNLAYSTKIVKF